LQSGTVFDNSASNPRSYWIPSVAMSRQGILAIGGSVAGTTKTPNAWYAARAPGETAGTVGGLTEYTSSSASYAPPFDRWGDYSLTRVDPSDGMTLWTIQEYIASTDTWGTRVAELRAPPPPAPTGVNGTVVAGIASTAVTVTGPPTNGIGYFDPGTGFPDRLSADVTGCGVTVNGVTSVAPGAVTLDLDTTGATPGDSCDVTITNPDGQAGTTNGLFTLSSNHAPIANADGPFQLTCCSPFNGPSVLTNDSDPDGNPITAVKVTDPAHGALSLASDGTFTYTPMAGFAGGDSFSYAASDGAAESAPAAVSLTVNAPSSGGGGGGGGGAGGGGGGTPGGTGTTTTTTPAPTGPSTTPAGSASQPALKVALIFGGKARLATILRRGLSGALRCGTTCTVRLTLKLPSSLARRLRIRTIVGSARLRVTGSGRKQVRIRLTRTARSKLARAKPFKLTLTVAAVDGAGHRSAARKTISVRR
jgi:hypothetical protein